VRAERGMKQMQLATAIGLEPTILSKIETGERCLDLRELVALSQTLDVEPDSLLWPGLEAAPLSAPLVAAGEARRAIGRRIAALRAARGMSQQRLAKEAGMGPSFFSRVESGAQRFEVGQFVGVLRALDVDTGVLLLRDPERTQLPDNVRQVRELLERLLTAAG
jgi:transcriptional regulator with XRE-family HTH domain